MAECSSYLTFHPTLNTPVFQFSRKKKGIFNFTYLLALFLQYDLFYSQHNISAAKYITEYLQKLISNVYYISSPEIGFLKTMGRKVDHNTTMLVFMVLEPNAVEPTTNQTYGSILKNLTAIKSFASGIVVPKSYVIPVNNKTRYLEPATTLVTDAHNAGLQVYASGFANDIYSSYSYNFEPEAEYLTFIDNSQFAVDGFITDFPTTATEAIGEIDILFIVYSQRNQI